MLAVNYFSFWHYGFENVRAIEEGVYQWVEPIHMNDFGPKFECHDKIREFCNMAYPTNTRLGCAYERCGSDLLISCAYEEGFENVRAIEEGVYQWVEPIHMNDFGPKFECHDKIREFCNMAYPTNTRLGCAYERCGSDLLISCAYEEGKKVPFKPLLELAPHFCVYKHYPNSACDEDYLCWTPSRNTTIEPLGPATIKTTTTTRATTTTTAPKLDVPKASCPTLNNKMTDEIRQIFLDTHNKWRSLVARGKAEDKLSPGYDHDEVAEMAVDQWAGELKKFGVGDNLIYPTPGLTGHYTQVVWQNTTRVGCYINDKCFPDSPGWKTQVVCQYKPTCVISFLFYFFAVARTFGRLPVERATTLYFRGNFMRWEVYSKGEPCKNDSDCKCKNCSCLAEEGLCYDPNSMTYI
ncbi:unnamed protein product [Nippostrongylus brasiliensis]|uniref:SCP domain-containing protein n=1 Tax=Nippostrongylus brasiliensis TaxID=27835 RepID=A0A158R0C1_NIPBR|nr:unnamed protein product [Nippostrongylus brasiliensis]